MSALQNVSGIANRIQQLDDNERPPAAAAARRPVKPWERVLAYAIGFFAVIMLIRAGLTTACTLVSLLKPLCVLAVAGAFLLLAAYLLGERIPLPGVGLAHRNLNRLA